MAPAAKPKPGVFVLVSILLVASGVVFSRLGSSSEAGTEGAGGAGRVEVAEAGRVALETARMRSQVDRAARRFVPAFLRYEVGDIDAAVRRTLRATATAEFAADLLAVPPRPPAAGFPPRARLLRLAVRISPNAAFHAFVEGTALRGSAREALSLEFEYGEGGWRASGVTE
ncbi:MAG TPA: hypothetical protein VFL89_07655 [Solirubrobacterales bacterium]|nr:hypothetical protein [Solirubrobacterales bacterium]